MTKQQLEELITLASVYQTLVQASAPKMVLLKIEEKIFVCLYPLREVKPTHKPGGITYTDDEIPV